MLFSVNLAPFLPGPCSFLSVGLAPIFTQRTRTHFYPEKIILEHVLFSFQSFFLQPAMFFLIINQPTVILALTFRTSEQANWTSLGQSWTNLSSKKKAARIGIDWFDDRAVDSRWMGFLVHDRVADLQLAWLWRTIATVFFGTEHTVNALTCFGTEDTVTALTCFTLLGLV